MKPFCLHEVLAIRDKARSGKQVSPKIVEQLCETVFWFANDTESLGEIHQMLVETLSELKAKATADAAREGGA